MSKATIVSFEPQLDALIEDVNREISVANVDALMAIDRVNRAVWPFRDKQAFAVRRAAKYEADIIPRLEVVAAFLEQRVKNQAAKQEDD